MHLASFSLIVHDVVTHDQVGLRRVEQSFIRLQAAIGRLEFDCLTHLVMWRNKLDTLVRLLPNVRLNLDIDGLEIKAVEPAKVVPMIRDIWCCPMARRSSLGQKGKFTRVFWEKVRLEGCIIHTICIVIVVLPDVQSSPVDVSGCSVEDNPLDSSWSSTDNAIVHSQVFYALRPLIMLPVCADVGVCALFRQSSIQIMEDAFKWPSPSDFPVHVSERKLREASRPRA